MVAVALISPLTSVYSLLHILDLTPHLPLRNPWPKLKHAEQSRQVLSNRPEHSVLRVLTFHPGVNGRRHRSGAPPPPAPRRPEHNTDPTSRVARQSQRHAEKVLIKEPLGEQTSQWHHSGHGDTETRRRETLVEVQGCRVWACYSGSRCQCRIVPPPVRASCQ